MLLHLGHKISARQFLLSFFQIFNLHPCILAAHSIPSPTPSLCGWPSEGSARGGRSLNTPALSRRPLVDSMIVGRRLLPLSPRMFRCAVRTHGRTCWETHEFYAHFVDVICAPASVFVSFCVFFKGAEVKQSFPTTVRAFIYSRLLASRFTHLHKREGGAERRSFYREVYLRAGWIVLTEAAF